MWPRLPGRSQSRLRRIRVLVIGLVDNLLRPILIGQDTAATVACWSPGTERILIWETEPSASDKAVERMAARAEHNGSVCSDEGNSLVAGHA
jgi:hypothetical protein